MASVESPCFLLTHGAVRSSVYFCVPVDAALSSRSSVLATMLESGGVKELPVGISLDDFQAWSTIAPQRGSGHEPEELACAMQVRFATQSRVLIDNVLPLSICKGPDSQVADKMCDTDLINRLAHALAHKISSSVSFNDPKPGLIQQVLNSLSKPLRTAVFQQMWHVELAHLATWPLHLQHEILDVRVRAGDSPWLKFVPLEADSSGDEVSTDTLSLLSRTTPATPGLQRLYIPAHVASPTTAALLSQALLHHTTLSTLSLPSLAWHSADAKPPAPTIYLTLPHLSLLTSLTLSFPVRPTPDLDDTEATVCALAAAISALPNLAAVSLWRDRTAQESRWLAGAPRVPAEEHPLLKRRRLGGVLGRPDGTSADAVVAALSTAPALTALRFRWQQHPAPQQLCVTSIRGPFTSLRVLHVFVDSKICIHPHDTRPLHLDALPALRTLSVQYDAESCEVAPGGLVIAAAAKQPALQTLAFWRGCKDRERSADQCGIGYHPVPATAPPGVPPEASSRGLLLRYAPIMRGCQGFIAALSEFCQIAALRRLHLSFDHMSFPNASPDAPPWQSMLQPITALTQLRDLRVVCRGSRVLRHRPNTPAVVLGALLAAPLSALTQLTALGIHMEAQKVPASRLAGQLPALSGLQQLSLWGLQCADSTELQACLAPLTRVTYMDLEAWPVDAAVVRGLAAGAARMPRLQLARLRLCWLLNQAPWSTGGRCAKPGWADGLRGLPCWGRYVFEVGELPGPADAGAADAPPGVTELPAEVSEEGGPTEEHQQQQQHEAFAEMSESRRLVTAEAGVLTAMRQELISRGARVSEGCREVDFGSGGQSAETQGTAAELLLA